MKKNNQFKYTLSVLCVLSLFTFHNTFAYSITTPRVNLNDLLTKSLWNRVVDDLEGLMNAIADNVTDITAVNTDIGDINTDIVNLGTDITALGTAITNIDSKFIDGTNPADAVLPIGKVGIGTLTPGATLSLGGTSGVVGSVDKLALYENGTNKYGFNISPNTLEYIVPAASHVFYTNSQKRFIINTLGNVGIGVDNPGAKLEVAGGIKLGNDTSICSASKEGTTRYNAVTKVLEFCNGTIWGSLSSGLDCATKTTNFAGTNDNVLCDSGYTITGGGASCGNGSIVTSYPTIGGWHAECSVAVGSVHARCCK